MNAGRGYTVVELLVVMAVLGLLVGMAMPLAEVTVQRQKERELKRALWQIRDAIDAFRAARLQGAVAGAVGAPPYPSTLGDLMRLSVDMRTEHRGESLRFLRRIPRDPFSDPSLQAEQSWGLRGFLSEADDPKPGAEVYDVYSLSARIGLNGVPLRRW